jgi:hypothetical protein
LIFKIDDLVTFMAENERGSLILDLRYRLDELVTRFLSVKNFTFDSNDEKLIKTVVKVIELEEKNSGFELMTLEEKPTDQSSWRGNNTNTRRDDYSNRNRNDNRNYSANGNQMGQRPTQGSLGNPKPNQVYQNGQRQHQRPKLEMNFSQQTGMTWRNQNPMQQQNNQQSNNQMHKVFIMKMNNIANINDWAAKIVLNISELGLNDWLTTRLTNKVKTKLISFENILLKLFFLLRTSRKFSSCSTRPHVRSFSDSETSCLGSITINFRSVWQRRFQNPLH